MNKPAQDADKARRYIAAAIMSAGVTAMAAFGVLFQTVPPWVGLFALAYVVFAFAYVTFTD